MIFKFKKIKLCNLVYGDFGEILLYSHDFLNA